MSNTWTILILLVLASVAATSPRNTLRDGLLKIITKWQNNKLGTLPFALPSPGYINIDSQTTEYDGDTLTLDGNIVLQGLDTLTVQRLSVSESESGLAASLAINIPKLKLTADWYKLQSKSHFGFRWVDDRGTFFQVEISNVVVTADVAFGSDGTNTAIQSLTLDYSFGDTRSYLSDSYDWVTKKFNKKVPRYLRGRKYSLIEEATMLIQNKVNNALRGYTPERVKNIIRDIE